VDGLRFLATQEGHTVVADARPEDGGAGTALSAPQLFVAAVGACMLEFVANSCRLREIPFDRLTLDMEFEERAKPRRVGALDATIHIEPQPPEDVQRRLIGVAKHATLANTLMRPPEMNIQFADK
jgi:uncharacterized OsmC-like protein